MSYRITQASQILQCERPRMQGNEGHIVRGHNHEPWLH